MYYYIYCQDVEGWPYVCILGVYIITYTHPLYIITTGYVAYLVTYVITYIYQIYTYAL